MTKEKAIQILNQRECCRECVVDNGDCNDCEKAFEMAIKALEQQPSEDDVQRVVDYLLRPIGKPSTTFKDCVSLGVYEQVAWERDTAIEQLKELGYEFGEKIRTSDDCETKLMYSAEEVNQILFDITLEKAKLEEKLKKVES